jgi:4-amino-4-deoxy-L-arabinose transferase-like glycosyltransferase
VPVLIGLAVLVAVVTAIFLLRPRDGRERWIARLPGMWIVLGLALTTSCAVGVALVIAGLGAIY